MQSRGDAIRPLRYVLHCFVRPPRLRLTRTIGWWHLVVNLSPSLALTQNFVPLTQLPAAIEFLRDQARSVSGFDTRKVEDPYALFMQRMTEQYPMELENASIASGAKKRKRWDELVGSKGGDDGFTFSFGDQYDSEND